MGVASYVATPHVAPYVYVCVGGWEGEGGVNTVHPLEAKPLRHSRTWWCILLCVSVCLYVCKSEMRGASEAGCTPAAGLITAG